MCHHEDHLSTLYFHVHCIAASDLLHDQAIHLGVDM